MAIEVKSVFRGAEPRDDVDFEMSFIVSEHAMNAEGLFIIAPWSEGKDWLVVSGAMTDPARWLTMATAKSEEEAQSEFQRLAREGASVFGLVGKQ